MKSIIIISLSVVLSLFHSVLFAQETFCAACSREAWAGDSVALNKFIASCGVIDTVSYDSLNNPVKEKATYQTITMKLNSGKVMFRDSIYFVVDSMPEFAGGEKALFSYLSKNIKYPPAAHKNGISGTVFVKFIIEKDGSIKQLKVLKSVGGGCDEEAVRVIKAMPRWKPGYHHGNEVRVQMNMPVRFTLH